MRSAAILCGFLLFTGMFVLPAGAFISKNLDIAIDESGDAVLTLDYELNLIEDIMVWLKIADPADEIRKAIESNTGRSTEVYSATMDSAVFRVSGYATTEQAGGGITQTAPELSFEEAERVLKNQWFSALISQDLSPLQ